MTFYQDEVDRHIEWMRVPDGPTPQRSTSEYGSAEAAFLVGGLWLTVLAGEDDGDDEEGVWFWACDPEGKDFFEFVVPYGEMPSDEQVRQVKDVIAMMGTNHPYRIKENGWGEWRGELE